MPSKSWAKLRSHGQVEDMNSKSRVCPVCMGTGKIVIGYEAICTEPVEKVKRCPECDGEGSLQIYELMKKMVKS